MQYNSGDRRVSGRCGVACDFDPTYRLGNKRCQFASAAASWPGGCIARLQPVDQCRTAIYERNYPTLRRDAMRRDRLVAGDERRQTSKNADSRNDLRRLTVRSSPLRLAVVHSYIRYGCL